MCDCVAVAGKVKGTSRNVDKLVVFCRAVAVAVFREKDALHDVTALFEETLPYCYPIMSSVRVMWCSIVCVM